MTPGDVVPLKPRKHDPEAPPIRRRRPPAPFCAHHHVEVDERARRLICSDCEADVDPFAFLEYMAHNLERYTGAVDRARQDAKRAQEQLEAVKRELRNAKARRRRAER